MQEEEIGKLKGTILCKIQFNNKNCVFIQTYVVFIMFCSLLDNGFRSVRNLQGVQLGELNFLNMAEKIRIKPLLAAFLKSNVAISGK